MDRAWPLCTVARYGQPPITATVPAGKGIKVQAANPELGTKNAETVIVSDSETTTGGDSGRHAGG